MHLEGKQSGGTNGVVGIGIWPSTRSGTNGSARDRLGHGDREESERGHLTDGALQDRPAQRPVGEFVVRRERHAGTLILWLSGVLDRATAALLEREIGVLPDPPLRVVIDLTGLASIDASGVDTIMRIQQRLDGSATGPFFRLGPHVARQPLELARTVQLRAPSVAGHKGLNDEDSYLALAMACADVDHLRVRDRTRGTSTRFPRQAAGTSDASSLPSVALAAPAPLPVGNPRRQRPLHRVSSDRSVKPYLRAVADAARDPQDALACTPSDSAFSVPEETAGSRDVEWGPPAA
jgi:anti-anti-sigma regulatory factor